MNVNSTTQDILNMELKQIGAKVRSVHGIVCYISFFVANIKITYLYNINKNNDFFLQRINPYPLSVGVFKKQSDIVNFIKKDIKRFEAASQHSCFQRYIDLNLGFYESLNKMENLFIDHDMSQKNFKKLESALDSLNIAMEMIEENIDDIDYIPEDMD
jgi:hypothetical protein